jgi:PAS domain S-box-containing protein
MATALTPFRDSGWTSLFWSAFKSSKNGMVLVDGRRRHVEVNGAYLRLLGYRRDTLIGRHLFDYVVGGPIATDREWQELLRQEQFTGVADLRRKDGGQVRVEFAGHPAVVTGTQHVLFVVLTTTRRGRRLYDVPIHGAREVPLTRRELEIVRLIALGSSGPEIADELQVAHNTVRTHVRNAMTKSGAHSRAQLVAKLMGGGFLWADRT